MHCVDEGVVKRMLEFEFTTPDRDGEYHKELAGQMLKEIKVPSEINRRPRKLDIKHWKCSELNFFNCHAAPNFFKPGGFLKESR